MEVHHKDHLPKNWKEYLTEFLMLFAAVTLGFFAENIREHQIESHRATVFLEQIKNDLKSDIRRLENTVESVERSSKQNQRETDISVKEVQTELRQTRKEVTTELNQSKKETELAIKQLNKDVDNKIQKALDNPLANK